jgi:hypothetical protein
MTILLLAGLVYAQSTCGPNPMVTPGMAPMNTPNVNQQRAQQKQIDMMNAQYEFQKNMQQLQHNFRIQQMQNQGNPQMQNQMAQSFQQQVQSLQQNFQQQVQRIQSQP